ncbi:MAG: diacylglycerol/lipid kinase family protein [Gemmobacter sp.]
MNRQTRRLDLGASNVALVLNHAAGRKDAEARTDSIRTALTPRVAKLTVHPVAKGKDIAAVARQAVLDGADVVVALGGDGTQSAVAGALAGGDAVMGVLPGGTFNYFARELGVGDTVEAALETLLSGHVATLDVGEVNGRFFLNNASFGVYPEILERREAIYRRWGRSRIAAYWSVLLTLRDMRDPMHLRVTLDGAPREFHTPLAFAARSAFQLESLGLDGADAVRNGQMALFLAKAHRPRDLLAAAFRLAFGKVSRGQDFELLLADDIQIETRHRRRLMAFDGEKARVDGPFRLRVHAGALSVIVPAPEAAAAPG